MAEEAILKRSAEMLAKTYKICLALLFVSLIFGLLFPIYAYTFLKLKDCCIGIYFGFHLLNTLYLYLHYATSKNYFQQIDLAVDKSNPDAGRIEAKTIKSHNRLVNYINVPFIIANFVLSTCLPSPQTTEFSGHAFCVMKLVGLLQGLIQLYLYYLNNSIELIVIDINNGKSSLAHLSMWALISVSITLYYSIKSLVYQKILGTIPCITCLMILILLVIISINLIYPHRIYRLVKSKSIPQAFLACIVLLCTILGYMAIYSAGIKQTIVHEAVDSLHYIHMNSVKQHFNEFKYVEAAENVPVSSSDPLSLPCAKEYVREMWENVQDSSIASYACIQESTCHQLSLVASRSFISLILMGFSSTIILLILWMMTQNQLPEYYPQEMDRVTVLIDIKDPIARVSFIQVISIIMLIIVATNIQFLQSKSLYNVNYPSYSKQFKQINDKIFQKSVHEVPVCNFTLSEYRGANPEYQFIYHIWINSSRSPIVFKGMREGLMFDKEEDLTLHYKGLYKDIRDICGSVFVNNPETQNEVKLSIKVRQEDDVMQDPIFEHQSISDILDYNQNPFDPVLNEIYSIGSNIKAEVTGNVADESMNPIDGFVVSFIEEDGEERNNAFIACQTSPGKFTFQMAYSSYNYGFIKIAKEGYITAYKEFILAPLSWNLIHVMHSAKTISEIGQVVLYKIPGVSQNLTIFPVNVENENSIKTSNAYLRREGKYELEAIADRSKEITITLPSSDSLFKITAKNYYPRAKFIMPPITKTQLLLHPINGASVFNIVLYWNNKIQDIDIKASFRVNSNTVCNVGPYNRYCGGAVYNEDFNNDIKGEEAIIFNNIGPFSYIFYASQASKDSISMKDSEATLSVFIPEIGSPVYISHAPQSGTGKYWKAFCINGKYGVKSMITFDSFTDLEPTPDECDRIYEEMAGIKN